MLVETPEIYWHGNCLGTPINTVDVQPNATTSGALRIATGGGEEVRIWLVSPPSRNANNAPVIDFRASLPRHEGQVNVVRFSPNGTMLATADTNGMILVWERVQDEDRERERERIAREDVEKDAKAKKIMNRKHVTEQQQQIDIVDIEIWTSGGKKFKKHLRDVIDLAWSPDSRYFCSTSLDDTAIIFEVEKLCPLKIMNDAEHFVLGVAWHPHSVFVSTLSMDKSLRFYHPFTESDKPCIKLSTLAGDKLYFDEDNCIQLRQLDFSPDGNFLLTTSGIYKDAACSYIYRVRKASDKITKPFLVLPSAKPTSTCKFCPRLFKLRNGYEKAVAHTTTAEVLQNAEVSEDIVMEEPQSAALSPSTQTKANSIPGVPMNNRPLIEGLPYRMIFAIGSGALVTLYDTQVDRPVAIINGIHLLPLTDIAWSSDGKMMVISSADGYCSFVEFEGDELGEEYDGPQNVTVMQSQSNAPKIVQKSAPNILQVRRVAPCLPSTSKD